MKFPNLRIVPLTIDHLSHVMRWVNDPAVMQYFAEHQKPISLVDEHKYLSALIDSNKDRVYSIFDGDDYIGQCSLNAIYHPARNARLFVVILPEHQNKGYGPEVIRRIVGMAFSGFDLHKIWLIVRKDNKDAQAMYLKLGFDFEGVLLDEYRVGDVYYDMVRMSIINPVPIPPPCGGCGIRVLHKMCIAHGTEAYGNPKHPAWGNEDAIEQLKMEALKGRTVTVKGHENEGERTIVGIFESIEGGVMLNADVDGHTSWNIQELNIKES